jgi:hypothetical protein
MRIHGKILRGELYDRMVFRIYFLLLIPCYVHIDTRVHQKSAENVKDPMKMNDERGTRKNKTEPHDDGADDSPQQHFAVMIFAHPKSSEDHHHHNNIVYGECVLYHVTRNKFKRKVFTVGLQALREVSGV